MTRRPKTRAAAEAKPAPTSPEKVARAGLGRGAKAAAGKKAAAQELARHGDAVAKSSAKATPGGKPGAVKPAKPSSSPVPVAKARGAKTGAAAVRAGKAAPAAAAPRTIKPSKTAAPKTTAAKSAAAAARPGAKAALPKKAPARKTPGEKTAAATGKRAVKVAKAPSPRKAARRPAYLAAELGHPVDREGEPIGAASAMLDSDSALQEYALRLWRQMQSGGVVNRYMRAIERAGLTVDEVWTAGVAETRPTSSTADEMRRYKQRLLFRANLLEAILSETVADLHRLDGIVPSDAPSPPPDAAREAT